MARIYILNRVSKSRYDTHSWSVGSMVAIAALVSNEYGPVAAPLLNNEAATIRSVFESLGRPREYSHSGDGTRRPSSSNHVSIFFSLFAMIIHFEVSKYHLRQYFVPRIVFPAPVWVLLCVISDRPSLCV